MAATVNLFYYMAVFFICIDQGYGRWKLTNKEKNDFDIENLKKMSDKIHKEIEEFYRSNPDKPHIKQYRNNIDKLRDDLIKWNKQKQTEAILKTEHENKISHFTNKTDDTQTNSKEIHGNYKSESKREGYNIFYPRNDITSEYNSNRTENHWPKFDDILFAMGKIYDWKNDRWIKVKHRKKQLLTPSSAVDSRIDFLAKHKFFYRRVKLNTSKTKKHLVVAVTAVR